jgi:hypothetical protein
MDALIQEFQEKAKLKQEVPMDDLVSQFATLVVQKRQDPAVVEDLIAKLQTGLKLPKSQSPRSDPKSDTLMEDLIAKLQTGLKLPKSQSPLKSKSSDATKLQTGLKLPKPKGSNRSINATMEDLITKLQTGLKLPSSPPRPNPKRRASSTSLGSLEKALKKIKIQTRPEGIQRTAPPMRAAAQSRGAPLTRGRVKRQLPVEMITPDVKEYKDVFRRMKAGLRTYRVHQLRFDELFAAVEWLAPKQVSSIRRVYAEEILLAKELHASLHDIVLQPTMAQLQAKQVDAAGKERETIGKLLSYMVRHMKELQWVQEHVALVHRKL